ncbi:unnamed protein product [Diabrotica balteata]|uniref:Proteasome subunit alpha type-5 n=1 Tax=Diabrotica balteata TaxID=107213 RepID=A0A9N9SKE3_DIABA|nr:unnamed protein product [Diabrotica balteata]
MFLTRSEYDRGVNTFSPEGRLFQVEYAIEAIKLGSTAIGICTSGGVVLAVEKRITSPLMEPTTIEKIVEVDKHIGCAVSGLMADSRTMIDRARVECQNHWFVYNENISVESCAQGVSNLAIQFGDSDEDGAAMSRPFGVAILFAGIDEKGPQLYHMDPSAVNKWRSLKQIREVNEVKSLKTSFTTSFEVIKRDLTFIKDTTSTSHTKNDNNYSSTLVHGSVLYEVSERQKRSCNLMIFNMPQDGEEADTSKAKEVLSGLAGSDIKIVSSTRIGTFVQFDAKAIGSGSEGAQQSLQEAYHRSMTLEEATTTALTILKQVMEEKLNSSNVEVMTMTPKDMFHMFTKEQVEEVIAKLS